VAWVEEGHISATHDSTQGWTEQRSIYTSFLWDSLYTRLLLLGTRVTVPLEPKLLILGC
jgi:hypothetical protein